MCELLCYTLSEQTRHKVTICEYGLLTCTHYNIHGYSLSITFSIFFQKMSRNMILCQVIERGINMATTKPRIQAIIERETYKKFKSLCIQEDRTESNLAGKIITEYIREYELQNGEIKINE